LLRLAAAGQRQTVPMLAAVLVVLYWQWSRSLPVVLLQSQLGREVMGELAMPAAMLVELRRLVL
jgi:hypothetical protein